MPVNTININDLIHQSFFKHNYLNQKNAKNHVLSFQTGILH